MINDHWDVHCTIKEKFLRESKDFYVIWVTLDFLQAKDYSNVPSNQIFLREIKDLFVKVDQGWFHMLAKVMSSRWTNARNYKRFEISSLRIKDFSIFKSAILSSSKQGWLLKLAKIVFRDHAI